MSVQRHVSSNEKLYLTGARHFSELVMHAVLEGDGTISVAALQEAANRAHALLPGARLRLQGSTWVADAQPPIVSELKEYPRFQGDITAVSQDFPPFDPQNGRTLSISIARHDGRTLMIFRAIHAVMDGQGMQIWIKAIFAFLRGEHPEWTDSLMTEDLVLAANAGKKRVNEPLIPYANGPRMKAEKADAAFAFKYSRRTLRGTVPAIIAKLSIGLDKFLAPNKGERSLMLIPVDMRNDLNPTERKSTANLSLPLMLPVKKGQSWTELSQTLLDMLTEKKHIARGAWDWVYQSLPSGPFSWIFRQHWLSSLKRGRFVTSAVISHTGRQNLQEFSTENFQADDLVFLPCVIPIAPLSLILTETGHSTEITLVSVAALWDDPLELLDQAIEAAGLDELMVRGEEKLNIKSKSRNSEIMVFPDAHLNLHQLVERQVKKSPNNTALVFGDKSLTYAQMNARANQLARLLIKRGLKRSEFVGVGLERSFDVIISILAIMKAGGAYVPLDPSMPANRLEYMVDDSRARFVISLRSHAGVFTGRSETLVLDELEQELASCDKSDPNLPIAGEDLCYMIYTSGSTGNPKGAMNKHAALTNHFLWMQHEYPLNANDCTLQKTPISFDASLLEVFLPLQSGGRIIIAKPDGHKDTRYMLQLIRDYQVTFLSIVPSVFNLFLDEIDSQEKSSLKLVFMGGEEFTRNLYDKFLQRFPRANAVNLYGPAEAGIDTMTFDCRYGFQGRSVPIGRPVGNTEMYVVDEHMKVVAPGEAGELILAGVAIGPGYFNRPELTQEKYIAHPFRADSPYKAYRTGDLVRQLPDGQVEFLGRIDHQVKIRGVRIELGEIEHQMEQLPNISRAVVVAKDIEQQKTLIAYWTGDGEIDIRKALGQSLPEYMIPSLFMKLEKMPFNANGKVDRTALPEVKFEARPEDEFVPSGATQQAVAAVWTGVLKRPLAKRTHFFESGGNSLLAITLVVRVNQALKISLHPQDLIENPRLDVFLDRVDAVIKNAAVAG